MKKKMTFYGCCLLAMLLFLTSCGSKISSSEDLVKAISNAESMEQIDDCIESVQFDKRIEYQKESGKVILNDKEGRDSYTHKACIAYLYIVTKNADDVIHNKASDNQKSIINNIDKNDIPIRTAAAEILGSNKVIQLIQEAYSYYGLRLK